MYRRTYPRALAKNREYERRYPGDTAVIARIADLLAAEDVRLPDGDRLTVRRLQFLGARLRHAAGLRGAALAASTRRSPRRRGLSDAFLARGA